MKAWLLVSRLLLLAGALSLGGCLELLSTAPPQITAQDQIDTPRPTIRLTSVSQNITFADTLIDLYSQRTVDLRNTGYWMTAPLYAAGIATGAIMLHGADPNILVDIGLGTGGYYVLNQNLDFTGRAEVLSSATENWRCFRDAAEKVRFTDPKQPGSASFGDIVKARQARLERNLRKANAYLANGANADGDVRGALTAAIALGNSAKNLARQNTDAAAGIPSTLAKFRQRIETRVATLYFGKMQMFSAKATLDSVTGSLKELEDQKNQTQALRNSLDSNAALDPDRKNKQAMDNINVPGQADDSVAGNPAAPTAKEQKADENQAKIDNLGALGASPGGGAARGDNAQQGNATMNKKLRAMTYIITETVEQLTTDSQIATVTELPVELAKCVP